MTKYALYRTGSGVGTVGLDGETLRDVIERNIRLLVAETQIASCAGYRLTRVRVVLPPDDQISPRHIKVELAGQGLPQVAGTATEIRTGAACLVGPLPTPEEAAQLVWEYPPLTPDNAPEQYYDIDNPKHPRHMPYPA